ncbi:MAG: hypothetical protein MUF48_21955, partial [Pirellulaceae bacterium]|nr:hypothetical protein [Pirellulaceae bacterium]
DQQRQQRAEQALRPVYGVFQRVAESLADEALRHFDQRVDDAGQAVEKDVDRRELPSRDQLQRHAVQLRQLIEDDPAAHHRRADSTRALRPSIAEFVAEGRQWLVGQVTSTFRERRSPDDAEVTEPAVQASAQQMLDTARSRSQVRWAAIEHMLRQRYDEEVLPQVRSQLAGEQAARHAPELARNAWIPTEADLNSATLPLRVATLAALPVWRGDPPAETAVLEETWQLWRVAAEHALRLADNARKLQLEIVEDLCTTIRAEMRREPQVDRDKWMQRYRERATSMWRSRTGAERERYPDLFTAALDRINAILDELLDEAAEPAANDLAEDASPLGEPAQDPAMQPPVERSVTEPAAPRVDDPLRPADAATSDTDASGSDDADGAVATDTDSAGGADGGQENTGDADAADQGNGEQTAEEAEQPDGDDPAAEVAAEAPADQSPRGAAADTGPAPQRAVPPNRLDLFYRVGFWVLFVLLLLMATAWYWQVRHLRRLLATYQRPGPLAGTS